MDYKSVDSNGLFCLASELCTLSLRRYAPWQLLLVFVKIILFALYPSPLIHYPKECMNQDELVCLWINYKIYALPKQCKQVFSNLHRSCHTSTDMGHVGWDKSCKTKIWNFGIQVFVKEDIASFDISMNNMWSHFLVKIGKTLCNPNADSSPCSPIKLDTTVTSTCKPKTWALEIIWSNEYKTRRIFLQITGLKW